jgi:hypothetical protein
MSRIKYVRSGHRTSGVAMYVIVMNKTAHNYWKVEVSPCDIYGSVTSDPIAWDIFSSWLDAMRYFNRKYREYYKYVNRTRNLF